MSRGGFIRLACAGLLAAARAGAGGEPPGPAIEAREAEMAAVRLSQRNAELEEDAERLREQVRGLTVSLAAARAELDVLRARATADEWRAAEVRTPAESLERGSLAVVEASEELGLVVLDAGARSGMRNGMKLSILRGEDVIAKASVVDVREAISGAVVEKESREFPRAGDRAVVARAVTRER